MQFIDAPSTFFIGAVYDPATKAIKKDEAVYYDSRDFTTHGLVLGMTGSGKTGLSLGILEEAILDGVPIICVDPKGDLGNLLLTFPEFNAAEFQNWIDPTEATNEGKDAAAYAAEKAEQWKNGLADWGITAERMAKLKAAADYTIYTPGSDSGIPISIVASLKAPKGGFDGQEEALREQINGTVSAILSLAGLEVEPVKDPEHVLLANIFEHNWRAGKDLSLEDIVMQVQKPPFEKLGVMSVDQYFAEKDRFALAMRLNSMVASPSFSAWLSGAPLDAQSLLYTADGKPRVSILYTAHLNDTERMFVMTLVLETLLAWIRNQSGTSSLRALLYVDEIFGYFPPVANPPSKEPLLRLLKQARAFGLGVLLATQNPVDLDYKGLSNIGTWFIGRLQSDGDRERVLSGLKEAAASTDMDLAEVKQLVAGIGSRVFLLRNVHDKGKVTLFSSRWAMNFLAGPLTRQQIGTLMADKRSKVAVATPEASAPAHTPAASTPTVASAPAVADGLPEGYTHTQPVITGVDSFFLPTSLSAGDAIRKYETERGIRADAADKAALAYRPLLLAQAAILYDDTKSRVRHTTKHAFHVHEVESSGYVRWDEHSAAVIEKRDLDDKPRGEIFAEVPAALSDPKRLKELQADLVDVLYKDYTLKVPYNAHFKVYGEPDEEAGKFEARVNQAAREARDEALDKVTERMENKIETLEERIKRKERELAEEQRKAQAGQQDQLISVVEAGLSFLGGSRSARNISRIGRASSRTGELKARVGDTQSEIDELVAEMDALKKELEDQLAEVQAEFDEQQKDTEEYEIKPAKKDISVEVFAAGWLPYWMFTADGRTEFAPAVG